MLTYEGLHAPVRELVGRRPVIVPVPVLTPRLSSYWLNLVTAVPTNVARALIEGLEHDVLARDAAIRTLIPRALKTYAKPRKQRWPPSARVSRSRAGPRARSASATSAGLRVLRQADARRCRYNSIDRRRWRVVSAVGGENGYYFLDGLWALRGMLDRLAGGTGLARRDPQEVAVGDAIDFWRVIAVEPGKRLTLLAEMKMPGSATLEFELHPEGPGRTRIVVTGYFHPAGALGLDVLACARACAPVDLRWLRQGHRPPRGAKRCDDARPSSRPTFMTGRIAVEVRITMRDSGPASRPLLRLAASLFAVLLGSAPAPRCLPRVSRSCPTSTSGGTKASGTRSPASIIPSSAG